MKRDNQALRLAQMMQNRATAYPSYELALPLVEVGHSKLKKLSVDDIVLLGLDRLQFVLIDNDKICADLALNIVDDSCFLEIIHIDKQLIKPANSKKYDTLKISFGKLQSRKLDVGYRIDITHRALQDVNVIVDDKIYATGSLVSVDEELAVKIDKVEK